jgi:pimeloyl-ACP methyl ester carboxylesterase
VQGWSLGGSTAILLIGTQPSWFKSTVLWSSGGSNSRDQLRQARDPERNARIKKIILEGSAVHESWAKITYTRENYVSWIGFEAEDYLPNYHGAFLGIRGTKDFLPLHEPDWMKLLPGDRTAYHVIGGADHIFNVLEPDNGQGDRVVALTVDWFADTLGE